MDITNLCYTFAKINKQTTKIINFKSKLLMKKFYTLALSAAVAMSVSAAGLIPVSGRTVKNVNKASIVAEKIAGEKAELLGGKPAKAPAKANSYDMSGDYIITLGDYYFQGSVGEFEAEGSISVSGLTATVDCDEFPTVVNASTNLNNTVLRFKTQEYGEVTLTSGDVVYLKIYPYAYNVETEDIEESDFSATYDGEKFEIPADRGIAWECFTDDTYTEHAAWLGIYDLVEMVKGSPWEEYGTITFTDGILAPGFGLTLTEPSTCALYKNTKIDEYYRIDNPWVGMYTANGWNSVSPSVYIDASDASNVVMEMASTGINGGTDGIYYIMSLSYYNSLGDEETPDDYKVTFTKEDNTGKFTFPYRSCRMYASTSGTLYYACSTPTVMTFAIPDAGVDTIEINDNDGEVKYYNLQGVQVASPAAGQLVIRVQGNKATKTILR